jgi:hypothetical protein
MSEPTTPDHDEEGPHSVYRDPGWVVLSEHQDRLDVAFIEDELARAGIPSTTTRRADDDRVVFRVMVTTADEARARAVLGGSVAEPPSPASAAGKSQRLVWGLALVPGVAHAYAGETARGAVIFLAFLSCFYWAASDHLIVLAPFVLFWVDALGARAALQGKRTVLWRMLAWTAPLWIATPVVLLKTAPEVYIGSAGRAVCAAEERCDVQMEDDCITATAAQIGGSIRVRRALSECASFLEGRSCDEAYGSPEDQPCDTGPFCAFAGTPEENACIDVYLGTVEVDEPVRFTPRGPRGWGM